MDITCRETPNGHIYTLENGLELPSVTTIIDVISNPALNAWYGRLGIVKATQIRDDTADIGSRVHSIISRICKGESIGIDEWQSLPETVRRSIRAYVRWVQETNFGVLKSEKMVYSVKHGYAGAVDAIGKIDSKMIIVDFKSGNRIYREHELQIVAYWFAYEEMVGYDIFHEGRCVRLDKKTGAFEEKIINRPRAEHAVEVFLAALKIWKFMREN